MMIRYTTAVQTITIRGVDLSGSTVYVTYRPELFGEVVNASSVSKSYDAATDTTTLVVSLTQEQTARLRRGKCLVQVNWVKNGTRNATKIEEFELGENLLEEVI